MRSNATWDETAGALLGIAATVAFAMFVRKAWRDRYILEAGLNKPFKRVAAILLIFSTPVLIFGILQVSFMSSGLSDFAFEFSKAIFFPDDWNSRNTWAAPYGFFGVLIGLAFSFKYDAHVGRLVRWIRHG